MALRWTDDHGQLGRNGPGEAPAMPEDWQA